MEIKLENDQLIHLKLAKLKCSRGCQNEANYIVFEIGLFCTTCLSKLQDGQISQFATLQELSKIIADMTQNYKKSIKTGNNLLVLKAEAQTQTKVIKNLRDGLTIDVKSIFSKINHLTSNAQTHCLNQYRNQPLQNFFEPDITTSVLLNDSQLFINNLKNLKVVSEGNKITYEFKQSQKTPQVAKQNALKQIEKMGVAINNAQAKVKNIMNKFRQSTKKQ